MRRFLLSAFILSTSAAEATIFIGNPELTTEAAPEVAGVIVSTALLDLSGVSLESCIAGTSTLSVTASLDLLAGDTLTLPEGVWCSLTLEGDLSASGTVFGAATSASLTDAALSVPITEALVLDGPQAQEIAIVFEVSEWLAGAPAPVLWLETL